MAAVQDPHAALRLLELAQSMLGSTLTAFELISTCASISYCNTSRSPAPLREASPYYVLLETSDSESEAHANAQFEALMERAIESGIVLDAVIATSGAQTPRLWELRELISEAQALAGKNVKHDVRCDLVHRHLRRADENDAMQRAFPGIGWSSSAIWATATCITTGPLRRIAQDASTRTSSSRCSRR